MKFICDQLTISKALNIVSKAVTNRTTLPILKGILLKVTDENTLTLCASDLDITIENTITIRNGEIGSTVVLTKLFFDIIRKLPNEDIHFSLENNNINIKCRNSEFNIVGMNADEFPNLIYGENDVENINIEKNIFIDMVKKTSFAASIDETKGLLTGVLVDVKDNSINLVALDLYRMAITRSNTSYSNNVKKLVIPAKIINDISKILLEVNSEEESLNLILDKKRIIINTENLRIIASLLEGDFVNYNDFLKLETKTDIVVSTRDLLESIERASLLSTDAKNNSISIKIEESLIEINSFSDEGSLNEKINIKKEGEDITIGCNAKFVIEALKNIEEDEVKIVFNNKVSPFIIKPMEGDKFDYLIVPVRLH